MIKSILWDYDGTIANSNAKNYIVTLDLFRHEAPQIFDLNPPNLTSQSAFDEALKNYEDWRELYQDCYKLSCEETERLGSLWAHYQISSNIKTPLFSGIAEIIKKFSFTKQAVISQNGSENIRNVLSEYDIDRYFNVFVGIDEVPGNLAKPNHSSFITTLKKMNVSPEDGIIIYIGDHEVDTQFVRSTQAYLNSLSINNNIKAVAVSYGGSEPTKWKTTPDFIASNTKELDSILTIINGSD